MREHLYQETGIRIPIIPPNEDLCKTLYSLSMGPYRLFRGNLTVSLQRRRELVELASKNPEIFQDFNHFYRMCHQRPENLMIHCQHLDTKPDGYDQTVEFGDFPEGGLLLVWLRLCSSNRTWSDP